MMNSVDILIAMNSEGHGVWQDTVERGYISDVCRIVI